MFKAAASKVDNFDTALSRMTKKNILIKNIRGLYITYTGQLHVPQVLSRNARYGAVASKQAMQAFGK